MLARAAPLQLGFGWTDVGEPGGIFLRKHRRRSLAFAGAACALLLLAACSSSKSSSTATTTAGTAAAGSTAPAANQPTGSPIVIGTLGALSGPTYAQLGDEQDLSSTPKAWVAWTNAHGGIDGHPVKLDIIDDAGDPGRAVAAAHQLVADHVIAIVYDFDVGIELGYVNYLEQQGIPVVGGQDYDAVWEQNPDLFPTMATYSAKGYADDYVLLLRTGVLQAGRPAAAGRGIRGGCQRYRDRKCVEHCS